jgi:hypothetical protein
MSQLCFEKVYTQHLALTVAPPPLRLPLACSPPPAAVRRATSAQFPSSTLHNRYILVRPRDGSCGGLPQRDIQRKNRRPEALFCVDPQAGAQLVSTPRQWVKIGYE